MCNQIDVHVVHLSSGSCSFLFSQRLNFLVAPNGAEIAPASNIPEKGKETAPIAASKLKDPQN